MYDFEGINHQARLRSNHEAEHVYVVSRLANRSSRLSVKTCSILLCRQHVTCKHVVHVDLRDGRRLHKTHSPESLRRRRRGRREDVPLGRQHLLREGQPTGGLAAETHG